MDKQQLFDQYMSEYLKLSEKSKFEELIEKQKKILAKLVVYCNMRDINVSLYKSNEIADLEKDSYDVNDYIEAVMVYSQNIEDILNDIIK